MQKENELITKKELLDKFGISYGALYRWKRKGLIPDEWFIHRSTYTGQETFFPKELIFERVELILHLKDNMSLDEIASSFVPREDDFNLGYDEIISRGIADKNTLDAYLCATGRRDRLFRHELLCLMMYAASGSLAGALCAAEFAKESTEGELYVIEKDGKTVEFALPRGIKLIFGEGCTIKARISIAEIAEKLRIKTHGF